MNNSIKNLSLKKETIKRIDENHSKNIKGGAVAAGTALNPCKYMCSKDPDWSKRAKTQLTA